MNFETVAVSPEISSDALRQLEAQAQLYPDRRFWGNDATPPFLVRGFQLTGEGEPQYAVSLSYYVGPGLNRPEGNYLAHSYVIDRELLEQQNYNLPWIAACLPCYFKYYPTKGIGADQLEPLEVELDPLGQFKLFSFVAHELTEAGLYELCKRLMDHASSENCGEPLDFDLPPPHPELSRFYNEDMGQPAEAAPGPDALRLLRLAGLFAILPMAFKQNPTFTVNDGLRAPGGSGSGIYALRVARSEGHLPATINGGWPWLEFCLKVTSENDWQRLSALQTWLSGLLPLESFSKEMIDRGFKLDQRLGTIENELPVLLADSSANREALTYQILDCLKELDHCKVNLDAVKNRVWPLLEQLDSSDSCTTYIVFSNLVASSRTPLSPWLFEGILKCLVTKDGSGVHLDETFWSRLPDAVKGKLWEQSFKELKPPGYIPDNTDEIKYLNFALTSLKANFMSDSALGEIAQHLYNRLSMLQPNTGYGSHQQTIAHRIRWRLETLIGFTGVDNALLEHFVVFAARNFFTLHHEEYIDGLRSIVLHNWDRNSSQGGPILAAFITQIAVRVDTETAIQELLLNLPLQSGTLRKTTDFITFLDPRRFGHNLAMLIFVLKEMTEVMNRPRICDTERKDRNLPRYCDFQNDRTNRRDRDQIVLSLQQQVLSGLGGLAQTGDKVCVGMSYLALSTPPDEALYSSVKALLLNAPDEIARWILSGPDVAIGRGRYLAHFLEAAHKLGASRLEAAFDCVDDVVQSRKDLHHRYRLLSQLNNYLEDAEVPNRYKRPFRDELDEIKRRRESKRR